MADFDWPLLQYICYFNHLIFIVTISTNFRTIIRIQIPVVGVEQNRNVIALSSSEHAATSLAFWLLYGQTMTGTFEIH